MTKGEQNYEKMRTYEPLPTDDRTGHKSMEEEAFKAENSHEHYNPLYTPRSAAQGVRRDGFHSDHSSDAGTQNTVIERSRAGPNEVYVPVRTAYPVRRSGFSDEEIGIVNRGADDDRYGSRGMRRGYPIGDQGYYRETYEEKLEEKYEVEEDRDSHSGSP